MKTIEHEIAMTNIRRAFARIESLEHWREEHDPIYNTPRVGICPNCSHEMEYVNGVATCRKINGGCGFEHKPLKDDPIYRKKENDPTFPKHLYTEIVGEPPFKDDPQREIRETPKKHETRHGLEIEDLIPVRETPIATLGVGHKTPLQKAKQHPCYKCKYAKPGRTDHWQDTDCTRRRMCHKWHVWCASYRCTEFFCPICGQPLLAKNHEFRGVVREYFVCSMDRCGWSER